MGGKPKPLPAVPPRVKLAGVNYPWKYYGWDFGDPPPKYVEPSLWRPGWTINDWKEKDWKVKVKKDIVKLKELGIFAVRWFILGDGLTYGINDKAPYEDPNRKDHWKFDDPPELTQQFKNDFAWVLETLENERPRPMRLIPVLIDFQFCWPGTVATYYDEALEMRCKMKGFIKGGRADVLNNDDKRKKFFKNVLEPLLKISAGEEKYEEEGKEKKIEGKEKKINRETIYAWELINEPEGATIGSGEGENKATPPKTTVKMQKMLKFIEEGNEIINKKGFKSTVGYRRLKTIREWNKKSKKHQYLGVSLHQYHFYPKGKWFDEIPILGPIIGIWYQDKLPKHSFHQKWPCFIGEFATATEKKFQWPELSSNQTVYDRLKKIEERGYPVAFAWSMGRRKDKEKKKDPDKRPAHDWSKDTMKYIMKYVYDIRDPKILQSLVNSIDK